MVDSHDDYDDDDEDTLPVCPADKHVWEFVDNSFDHAFGTHRERYWECIHCGMQLDEDQHDPDAGNRY